MKSIFMLHAAGSLMIGIKMSGSVISNYHTRQNIGYILYALTCCTMCCQLQNWMTGYQHNIQQHF